MILRIDFTPCWYRTSRRNKNKIEENSNKLKAPSPRNL
jgi:hypothetical protein